MGLIPTIEVASFEEGFGLGVVLAEQDQQTVVEVQCVKWSVQLWWR